MPYAEQLTGDFKRHRHIVSTMENQFKQFLKKTDSVMLDLLKLQEENKKLKEENKKLQEENKKLKEENKKLKEQVNYWKNFALFYWSGHQLGEEANSDSDVWNEALEECNSSNNDDYDREALTKKCLSQ